MEPKDKELLLKDLCVRTPYGVMIQTDNVFPQKLKGIIFDKDEPYICVSDGAFALDNISCKPYLFPLSSMTEEQEIEFKGLLSEVYDFSFRMEELLELIRSQQNIPFRYIDWLVKNNFDYRGLIPMGLAIDATRLNIY